MKNIILQHQLEETSCGIACLQTILRYWGKKIPMAIVAEVAKGDNYGTSFYGLIDAAEFFGIKATPLKGSAIEFLREIRTMPLPLIARISNSTGCEHYVVIYKISKNKIFIADPDLGKYKLTFEDFGSIFLGNVLCFEPTPTFKKENRLKDHGLSGYIKKVIEKPRCVIALLLLSIFITAIGIISSYLYKYMVDDLIHNISNTSLKFFLILLLSTAFLYFCRFWTHFIRSKLLFKMNLHIQDLLHLNYFNHLQDCKSEVYDTHSTGDLINRASETNQIQNAISQILLGTTLDAVMVIGSGICLWSMNNELTSIVFVLISCYLIISLITKRPINRYNREILVKNSHLSSFETETIRNNELIRSVNAQDVTKNKIKSMFHVIQSNRFKLNQISTLRDGSIEFLYGIGLLLILWITAKNILAGTMTIGTFLSFNTLIGYFMTPIENIFSLQETIQAARLSIQRLEDIILRSKETDDGNNQFKNGDIEIKGLKFRYGNRDLVLNHFTLRINKGEKVALVGGSGCGKSTLLKLLLGFYESESGTVSIDNVALSDITKTSLRENIAYVSQETSLFADTIRNNLLFGNNNHITDEEIMHMLRACDCSFIDDLPFGLDSMLEEGGCNISGGQKQKLSIARALLRAPSILLLDEATSSLDAESEKQIMNLIYHSNCTVIMTAHRLSTVRICDQIVVMNHGTVSEYGTHHSLLDIRGQYYELCSHQNPDIFVA